ncbi:dTDP-4-dehydrorhamnose reductase [Nocardioides sp. Soil777]|nr:dTDP-4-dehydrorhamnose reductase [Nocardioides sp. Soil777]
MAASQGGRRGDVRGEGPVSLPSLETTPIPGLVVVRLDRRDDARGFFKENWQREKMLAIGLPDFGPVQNNVSFNADRGVTRGIHTEPWDKFVSLATGRIFGAWVDMREGDSFGATFSLEMDTSVAVFVPRGVGNSYQTLEDATAYTYLVNEHWRPGIAYPALALEDPTVAIPWPIPLTEAIISDKDQHNPELDPTTAIAPKRTLVLGAGGQLGKALVASLPGAQGVTRAELDVTDAEAVAAWPWHQYAVVLNAAAYTAVDTAETPDGRRDAWAANATAPATLARLSSRHGFTLVHYSSEYVFDGTAEEHTEDEPLSPLGVYAQSKAAGDIAVATAPRHYLLRTSWVIGEGNNFVRTMQRLASNGVSPSVVSDQVGRLTFTDELVRATRHLLESGAAHGTYHVSNGGPAMSWAEVAQAVFERSDRSADDVAPITTEEYAAGALAQDKPFAPRPLRSAMALDKIRAAGFEPEDALAGLERYLVASERP